mgnify:CR=1 FL=1
MTEFSDVTSSSEEEKCYVCGAAAGPHWFAKVNLQTGTACICSPACALLFSEAPRPDSSVSDRIRYYKEQLAQIEEAVLNSRGFCSDDFFRNG